MGDLRPPGPLPPSFADSKYATGAPPTFNLLPPATGLTCAIYAIRMKSIPDDGRWFTSEICSRQQEVLSADR